MAFWSSTLHYVPLRRLVGVAFFSMLLCATRAAGQHAPSSPDRPWHSSEEQEFKSEMRLSSNGASPIDPAKTYSLPELINLAEIQNPETREAWEQTRAHAAILGIAKSELYPILAATAVAEINRREAFSHVSFYRQTVADTEGGLALSYTVFDFGARAGRISAAKADVLAANFAFNDTHRQVIFEVEMAYYSLLNAEGQISAAEANLTNALAVQRAAEDRLNQGLATSPDVLEARSAAAQAEYELQALQGTKEISRGNLARALGILPTSSIQVQPLDELVIPVSFSNTVEQSIDRAFEQRPDLMQQLAEVRAAEAQINEARATYYPTLSFSASAGPRSFYASQQSLPWEHTANWGGGAGLSLTWSLFDGGARRHKLAQAKADALGSEAKAKATRDSVANEVWTAYSKFRTAFRERQAAVELLAAARQSYAAALESYNHGVRSLLDVTAAQRTLAQARSSDVLARTAILSSVAELAFQTGSSIQSKAPKKEP